MRRNLIEDELVNAALACPYHVYRYIQKHVKSHARSRRLLACIYLEALVKRPQPLPMDVHCVPMVLVRTEPSLFTELLTVAPTLYRRLHHTYKYHLQKVAATVDPCNLWYGTRFFSTLVTEHAALLRSHVREHVYMHAFTACQVAELVLPYEEAIEVYCTLQPRFRALVWINRGLEEEHKILAFAGTAEELQREALSRYLHKERLLAVTMGQHSRLGGASLLHDLPTEVFKLCLRIGL